MKLKSIFTPFTSIRLSFELIWRTNRFYTVLYFLLAVFLGTVPMAKLVVAKWIIDAIVEGIKTAPLAETYPSVLLLILLEFGLVLLLDALKLLNRLVEAAILRKKVYRFIINELERVSPQTPYALCRAPRVMWDEFAEDFAKHGQTPDYYVCNCGPTSAPGHELLLRKVAAVDIGQLARGQGAGEKGRRGERMSPHTHQLKSEMHL